MMRLYVVSALAIATLATSACGDTRGQRAISGGAIGAGVGALGSGVTGGNPLGGAVVGGAAGAAVGGLTDKKDIDLGDFPD